jgi:hypothetical protein
VFYKNIELKKIKTQKLSFLFEDWNDEKDFKKLLKSCPLWRSHMMLGMLLEEEIMDIKMNY